MLICFYFGNNPTRQEATTLNNFLCIFSMTLNIPNDVVKLESAMVNPPSSISDDDDPPNISPTPLVFNLNLCRTKRTVYSKLFSSILMCLWAYLAIFMFLISVS